MGSVWRRVTSIFVRLGANLLENVVAQMFVSFFTIATVTGVASILLTYSNDYPYHIILAMAVVWFLSNSAAVAWFLGHRRSRQVRMEHLGRTMLTADTTIQGLWLKRPTKQGMAKEREQMKIMFMAILDDMCHILAYRIPHEKKGATLLLISGKQFRVFAQVRQNNSHIADHVKVGLPIDKGLAAKCMRTGTCQVLRDCTKASPDSGIEWVTISSSSTHRGRACTPINSWSNNKPQAIGAICLDVTDPWELQSEDQVLMELFADKIENLWGGYIRRKQET